MSSSSSWRKTSGRDHHKKNNVVYNTFATSNTIHNSGTIGNAANENTKIHSNIVVNAENKIEQTVEGTIDNTNLIVYIPCDQIQSKDVPVQVPFGSEVDIQIPYLKNKTTNSNVHTPSNFDLNISGPDVTNTTTSYSMPTLEQDEQYGQCLQFNKYPESSSNYTENNHGCSTRISTDKPYNTANAFAESSSSTISQSLTMNMWVKITDENLSGTANIFTMRNAGTHEVDYGYGRLPDSNGNYSFPPYSNISSSSTKPFEFTTGGNDTYTKFYLEVGYAQPLNSAYTMYHIYIMSGTTKKYITIPLISDPNDSNDQSYFLKAANSNAAVFNESNDSLTTHKALAATFKMVSYQQLWTDVGSVYFNDPNDPLDAALTATDGFFPLVNGVLQDTISSQIGANVRWLELVSDLLPSTPSYDAYINYYRYFKVNVSPGFGTMGLLNFKNITSDIMNSTNTTRPNEAQCFNVAPDGGISSGTPPLWSKNSFFAIYYPGHVTTTNPDPFNPASFDESTIPSLHFMYIDEYNTIIQNNDDTTAVANVWKMISVVLTGSHATVYVDGVNCFDFTCTNTMVPDAEITINDGGYKWYSDYSYTGTTNTLSYRVLDFRMYNRSFSQSLLSHLYSLAPNSEKSSSFLLKNEYSLFGGEVDVAGKMVVGGTSLTNDDADFMKDVHIHGNLIVDGSGGGGVSPDDSVTNSVTGTYLLSGAPYIVQSSGKIGNNVRQNFATLKWNHQNKPFGYFQLDYSLVIRVSNLPQLGDTYEPMYTDKATIIVNPSLLTESFSTSASTTNFSFTLTSDNTDETNSSPPKYSIKKGMLDLNSIHPDISTSKGMVNGTHKMKALLVGSASQDCNTALATVVVESTRITSVDISYGGNWYSLGDNVTFSLEFPNLGIVFSDRNRQDIGVDSNGCKYTNFIGDLYVEYDNTKTPKEMTFYYVNNNEYCYQGTTEANLQGDNTTSFYMNLQNSSNFPGSSLILNSTQINPYIPPAPTLFTYSDSTISYSSSSTLTTDSYDTTKTLKEVKIGSFVTSISSNTFKNRPSLNSVTFAQGSTLASIGSSAFDGSIIPSIMIPDTVTEIGSRAFASCTKLTTVTIEPGSTLTIGDSAFASCTLLSRVDLKNNTIPSIHTNSFPDKSSQSITCILYFTLTETEMNILYSIFDIVVKQITYGKVTVQNATITQITTNNIEYVLFTFANTDSPDPFTSSTVYGNIKVDINGSSSSIESHIILVAGGGSGARSKIGAENYNFNYKAGAGGGGAGGGAYGTIDFTSTYNSIAVEVGKGGTGVATAEAMLTEYGVSGVAGDPTILSMNTNSNTSTIIKTFGGGGGNFVGSVNSANGGCTGGSSGVYNEVVEGSYTGSLFPSQSAQSNVPDLSFSFTSLSQKGGTSDSENGGGGGGGAGTAGSNGTSTKGGDGGDGFLWNITGSHYGGGGGGSGPDGNQGIDKIGTGGLGGGGTGADPYVVTVNGTNGLGGGGCAGFINHVYEGDGGSGVCIFAFKKSSIQ